jgi:hypothetical protein
MLENQGFLVQRIIYNGNYQGIVGSIQIRLNYRSRKTSQQGLFTNIFTKIIFHQVARLLNVLKMGDCIEIVAIKK